MSLRSEACSLIQVMDTSITCLKDWNPSFRAKGDGDIDMYIIGKWW